MVGSLGWENKSMFFYRLLTMMPRSRDRWLHRLHLGSEQPVRFQAEASGCGYRSISQEILTVLPGLHRARIEEHRAGKRRKAEGAEFVIVLR